MIIGIQMMYGPARHWREGNVPAYALRATARHAISKEFRAGDAFSSPVFRGFTQGIKKSYASPEDFIKGNDIIFHAMFFYKVFY